MPAKPVFTEEQHSILRVAARRVWESKFKARKKTQEDMALALGISQQSVSNLLKGTYKPGVQVAREIAILDGDTLENLIGDFGTSSRAPESTRGGEFPNLDACIRFFADERHWSPWTIAAARAGYFGVHDISPPKWAEKLDHLEKALELARKPLR